MTFSGIYGTDTKIKSGKDTRVTVTVPPLSVQVFKANRTLAKTKSAPSVYLTTPAPGGTVGGRAEIGAATPGGGFAQVSFAYRPVGTADWQKIGTDDNAPYRVFHDVTGVAKGTLVEYRAVLKDASGNLSATSSYAVVGDPAPAGGGGGGVGPVTQPDNVSVPGSHNTEMGCTGDWQPDCAQAQLALDPRTGSGRGPTPPSPAGNYEYKAAINKSWDENYGAGGVSNGPNIAYTAPGTPVSFYYDHGTHYATSSAQGPIITAPGSYQSELGCGSDWDPSCMRPWLQDPDGDGTFTWSGILEKAGDYAFKIAHGLSWDENYGAGGTPNGGNIAVSVPKDGTVLTISYVLATHIATTRLSAAGSAPDLTQQKAIWVSRDLLAWPATAIPAGTDPALLRWRLHWSPTANLAVDAETLTAAPPPSSPVTPPGCRPPSSPLIPSSRATWLFGWTRRPPSRRTTSCVVRPRWRCTTPRGRSSTRPAYRSRSSSTTCTPVRPRRTRTGPRRRRTGPPSGSGLPPRSRSPC